MSKITAEMWEKAIDRLSVSKGCELQLADYQIDSDELYEAIMELVQNDTEGVIK